MCDNIAPTSESSDNQNNSSSCSIDKIKDIVKYLPSIIVDGNRIKPRTVEKLKYVGNRLYEAMKTDDISIRLLDLACSNATRAMLRNNIFYHSIDAIRSVILTKSFAYDVLNHIGYVPAGGFLNELNWIYKEYPSIEIRKESFKESMRWSGFDMFIMHEVYNINKSGNPYKLSDDSELSVIETNICFADDFFSNVKLCDANGNIIDNDKCVDNNKENKENTPKHHTLPYALVKLTHWDIKGVSTTEYGLVIYKEDDYTLSWRVYANTGKLCNIIGCSIVRAVICKPGNALELRVIGFLSRDVMVTIIGLSSICIRNDPPVNFNKDVGGNIIKGVDYIFKNGGHRGYAFIGRPGSGKTSMMRMIIQHFTDIPTITLNNNIQLSKYNMYDIGDAICAAGKCILYIDDIDGYDLQTKNDNVSALIELFEYLNLREANYVFLCTANNARSINTSLIGRADRIDEVIEFSGLPINEIKKALENKLGIACIKEECNQGITDFYEMGVTYADINNISKLVEMYYDGELNKESIGFAISRITSTRKIAMLEDTV